MDIPQEASVQPLLKTPPVKPNDAPEDPNNDAAIVDNLKKELQCPVCDQIPNSLPIPCCPSGHILCKDCKKKIVPNGTFGEKRCPVCRISLGRNNTSYLAGSLISSLTDIPCSNKISGCSFQGTLDEIKDHLCLFKMLFCHVCEEEFMRKDFITHNTTKIKEDASPSEKADCFLKDDENSFNFPTQCCFYMVGGRTSEEEVLVEACNVEDLEEYEDGDKMMGFSSFVAQSSSQSPAKKIKLVIDSPDDNTSYKMEVVTDIETGPYNSKIIGESDFVLPSLVGKKIQFELIYEVDE